jgi:integrase
LDGTSIRGAKLGRSSNGEGSIAKRKDGRWSASYIVGGKRKYVYGKTRKEAAQKLRDALAEQDTGTYYPDIKLKDYLGQWLEDSVKDSVRERTYERYEQISRNHIVPELGDTNLPSLTEMAIQSLYRRKLDAGCSPRTVQYIHVTLHKALKQAVRWRLVPTNVTEGATPPKVSRKEIIVLSPDQVKVFFKGIRGNRLEAMFILATTTSLRQGELLGLRWEDIDSTGSVLYMVRTLSKTNRGVVFNPPKTAKGRRSVGLTQVTIEALKRHKTNQELEKAGWFRDHGLVFPNIHGEPRTQRGPILEALRKVLREHGLPEIRFHDLRHTCATGLLSKNVNPKIVSEMLGHGDVAFTLSVYSHVLKGMQEEAVAAMDEILDG